jgi:hypothetical protein
MTPRPLGDVLAHTTGGFVPRHPDRPPWASRQPIPHTVAFTGTVEVVPLEVAGRVSIAGLDQVLDTGPAYHEPDELLEDMVPSSWGVSTP